MQYIDNITLCFIQSVSYFRPYWAYYFQVPLPQFVLLMCLHSETLVYIVKSSMCGTIVWISSHSSADSIIKLSNLFSLCYANVTCKTISWYKAFSIVRIYTSRKLLQTSVTQKNILGFLPLNFSKYNQQDYTAKWIQ